MLRLLDNTVLSNFSAVCRPDLVHLALGNTVATPKQAFAELQTGIHIGKLPMCDWSWLSILSLTVDENLIYQQLLSRLNAGEAACLAIATTRKGRILTDDRDARELALQMQIPVSGTLGLLIRLIELRHFRGRPATQQIRTSQVGPCVSCVIETR